MFKAFLNNPIFKAPFLNGSIHGLSSDWLDTWAYFQDGLRFPEQMDTWTRF
jgi:hypothetical protein